MNPDVLAGAWPIVVAWHHDIAVAICRPCRTVVAAYSTVGAAEQGGLDHHRTRHAPQKEAA